MKNDAAFAATLARAFPPVSRAPMTEAEMRAQQARIDFDAERKKFLSAFARFVAEAPEEAAQEIDGTATVMRGLVDVYNQKEST